MAKQLIFNEEARRAVLRGVEKIGIKPERFAGGHGAVGNYADLERAVQNSAAR